METALDQEGPAIPGIPREPRPDWGQELVLEWEA